MFDLFEVFGEAANPGEIGSVHFGLRDKPDQTRTQLLVRLAFVLLLVAPALLWIGWTADLTFSAKLWIFGLFAAYLTAALFVHPEADRDNIGFFGGLIDHPFRYSDNINRTLLFFEIVLGPGKFVAESIVWGFAVVAGDAPPPKRRKRRKRRRPTQEGEPSDPTSTFVPDRPDRGESSDRRRPPEPPRRIKRDRPTLE
jgi:hypothetical protein